MPRRGGQGSPVDTRVGDQQIVDPGVGEVHGLCGGEGKDPAKPRYLQEFPNQRGAAYGLTGHPDG